MGILVCATKVFSDYIQDHFQYIFLNLILQLSSFVPSYQIKLVLYIFIYVVIIKIVLTIYSMFTTYQVVGYALNQGFSTLALLTCGSDKFLLWGLSCALQDAK